MFVPATCVKQLGNLQWTNARYCPAGAVSKKLVHMRRLEILSTAMNKKKIRAGLFADIFLPSNAETLYVNRLTLEEASRVTLVALEMLSTVDALAVLACWDAPRRTIAPQECKSASASENLKFVWRANMLKSRTWTHEATFAKRTAT
jgi:hypothetical protein